MGRAPGSPRAARGAKSKAPRRQESTDAAQDPLAQMKSELDGTAPGGDAQGAPPPSDGERREQGTREDPPDEQTTREAALIVICPGCKAKNRVSLARVRRLTPLCGQCKQELVVRG